MNHPPLVLYRKWGGSVNTYEPSPCVHCVVFVFYPLVFPVGGEGQVPVGVVRVGAVASQRVGHPHQIVVGVVSTRRTRPLVFSGVSAITALRDIID